ncbi:MAG: YgdI/YgdR family lipoprotein [Oscillospiraceae bacterium]|nr:YgdI/YgdR family lipoprotein [Oscillospiraceae bacterium]
MKKSIFLKKLTAVLLAAAMTLFLAGCTSNDTGNTDSEAAEVVETASARVTVEGTSFMVDGKEIWINGVNTPWQNWNDFTGNMDEEFWDSTFAQLAEDNINCTRIWINCNGESIIRLMSTGEIKEIREGHWTDLDKLFAIAEKHGVYIMATLLSFDHFKDGNTGAEKWRTLISDKSLTDAFAESYVAEFCQRYGDNEYLFSIDIMNEPDWVYENSECGNISWENLSYFFGKCAAVIHENCDTLVTVGLGMIKYNSDNYNGNMVSDEYLKELTGDENAYLDFYSTHYYMWQRPYYGFPCNISPVEFGLDGTKPCLIGETSNDDAEECGLTLTEKYQSCYDNGWNGIMVWMQPTDEGDEYDWYRYDLTKEATNAMAEYAFDKIYPIGKKDAAAADTAAEDSAE